MSEHEADQRPSDHGKKLKIEIDEKTYEAPASVMTGLQLKQLGNVPAAYRLFQEMKGGTDKEIKDTDSVQLEGGEEFYSLPLGTVGAALDDLLATELKAVQGAFPGAVLHEEGGNRHLHLEAVPLPAGWNRTQTEVLLPIPPLYPSAAIPGFEVDSDLRRANGAQPAGSGFQPFHGKQYLHMCWNAPSFNGQWISLEQAARFAISRFLEST
jgi:Multiubiquitin/Prokaryotic E2 family E